MSKTCGQVVFIKILIDKKGKQSFAEGYSSQLFDECDNILPIRFYELLLRQTSDLQVSQELWYLFYSIREGILLKFLSLDH